MPGDLEFGIVIRADGSAAIRTLERTEQAVEDLGRGADTATRSTREHSRATDEANRAAARQVTTLGQLRGALRTVGAGVAALGLKALVTDIVHAGTAWQSMQSAMTAATGSAAAANRELAFARAEADRLGLSQDALVQSYTRLTAASRDTVLQGQRTRDIFTAVTEASRVLGLSAEATGGTLTAIEQIISKGTVSAEELRGQLGERLPGAFQIAARAMGVTTSELDDMLRKGEVLAEDLLPKLAVELRRSVGDGLAEATDSAAAAFERLANSWNNLKIAIAESGVLDLLALAAAGLTTVAEFVTPGSASSEAEALRDLAAAAKDVVDAYGRFERQANDGLVAAADPDVRRAMSELAELRAELDEISGREWAFEFDSPEDLPQAIFHMIEIQRLIAKPLEVTVTYDDDPAGRKRVLDALHALADLELAVAKAHEARRSELDKNRTADRAFIADLERELELAGASELTLKQETALRRLSADATAAQRDEVRELATALHLEETRVRTAVDEWGDYATALEHAAEHRRRARQSSEDLIASLERELELAGLGGRERFVQGRLDRLPDLASDADLARVRELATALWEAREAARAVRDEADPIADAYERVADGIHESVTGAFEDILRDGRVSFDNLGDGILATFRRMLAEMATLAIAQPIIVPVVQQVGGLLGVSPSAIAGITGSLGGAPAAGGLGGLFGGNPLVSGLGRLFSGLGGHLSGLTAALNRFGATLGFGLPASALTASQTLALAGPLGGLVPGTTAAAGALGYGSAGALTGASLASVLGFAAIAIPIITRLMRGTPRGWGKVSLDAADPGEVITGSRNRGGEIAEYIDELLGGIREAIEAVGGFAGTSFYLYGKGANDFNVGLFTGPDGNNEREFLEGTYREGLSGAELRQYLEEVLQPLIELRAEWQALTEGPQNAILASFDALTDHFDRFRERLDILGATLEEVAEQEEKAADALRERNRAQLDALAGRPADPVTLADVRAQFDPFREALEQADGRDLGFTLADVVATEGEAVENFIETLRAQFAALAGEAPSLEDVIEALRAQFSVFRENAEALGLTLEEIAAAEEQAIDRLEAQARAPFLDFETQLVNQIALANAPDELSRRLLELEHTFVTLGDITEQDKRRLRELVTELYNLDAAAAAAAEAERERARQRAENERRKAEWEARRETIEDIRGDLRRRLALARGEDPREFELQDLRDQLAELGPQGEKASAALLKLLGRIHALEQAAREASAIGDLEQEVALARAPTERRRFDLQTEVLLGDLGDASEATIERIRELRDELYELGRAARAASTIEGLEQQVALAGETSPRKRFNLETRFIIAGLGDATKETRERIRELRDELYELGRAARAASTIEGLEQQVALAGAQSERRRFNLETRFIIAGLGDATKETRERIRELRDELYELGRAARAASTIEGLEQQVALAGAQSERRRFNLETRFIIAGLGDATKETRERIRELRDELYELGRAARAASTIEGLEQQVALAGETSPRKRFNLETRFIIAGLGDATKETRERIRELRDELYELGRAARAASTIEGLEQQVALAGAQSERRRFNLETRFIIAGLGDATKETRERIRELRDELYELGRAARAASTIEGLEQQVALAGAQSERRRFNLETRAIIAGLGDATEETRERILGLRRELYELARAARVGNLEQGLRDRIALARAPDELTRALLDLDLQLRDLGDVSDAERQRLRGLVTELHNLGVAADEVAARERLSSLVAQSERILGLPQLRDALAQIDSGAFSPLSPAQQLADTRAALDNLFGEAIGGVPGAAEEAAALARRALELARDVFASAPRGQQVIQDVRHQLETLLEIQERRQGTLGADLIEQVQLSTDEQIAAIREQTRAIVDALADVRRTMQAGVQP